MKSGLLLVPLTTILPLLATPALAQTTAPQVTPAGAGNLAGQGPKIDLDKAKAFKPPRTEFGHPNLEGIWQPRASGAAFSVLPHEGGFFLGQGSETGIVEGGVLPYQPWAAEQVKYRRDHVELDPTGHCHSDQLRVVERYTLQDENTLIWEATLTNPKVFTGP